MRDKALDCAPIRRIKNGSIVPLCLAIGFAADDHRIDDGAERPAAFGAGGFDQLIVRRQRGNCGVYLMAGRTGDEDQVRMRGGIRDPGR